MKKVSISTPTKAATKAAVAAEDISTTASASMIPVNVGSDEKTSLPPSNRNLPDPPHKKSLKKRIKKMFKKRSPRRQSLNGSTAGVSVKSMQSLLSLGTIDLSNHNDIDELDSYEYDDAFYSCYGGKDSFRTDAESPLKGTSENASGQSPPYKNDSDSSPRPNQDSNKSADDILNHHLSDLYNQGKAYYSEGLYEKAWGSQIDALRCLSEPGNDRTDGSSLARQEAMIRYELAKIKYDKFVETADHMDGLDRAHLSRLSTKVENCKCKVSMQNLSFYQGQLANIEKNATQKSTGIRENDAAEKLYILHTLGKLYDKDLHRYEEALKYYNQALQIEEPILQILRETGEEQEISEWTLRVRKTRRKIGSIHYTSGRFDLALFSSFSSKN